MTPFHPKFRQLLLADREHQKRGLTPGLLLEYETLETQLFYVLNYPAPGEGDLESVASWYLSENGLSAMQEEIEGDDYGQLLDALSPWINEAFRGLTNFRQAILNVLLKIDGGQYLFDTYIEIIIKYSEVQLLQHLNSNTPTADSLLDDIERIRRSVLINFDAIHQRWIKLQQNASKKRYLDTGLNANLFGFFIAIYRWFFPEKTTPIEIRLPDYQDL